MLIATGFAGCASVASDDVEPAGGRAKEPMLPTPEPNAAAADATATRCSKLGFPSIPLATTGRDPSTMVAADVDGDGKQDLVVLLRSSLSGGRIVAAKLSVLLANGDGTFQPSRESSTDANVNGGALAVADVNGDGTLDAVVTSEFSSTSGFSSGVRILLGRGDGTFQTGVGFTTSASPVALAVADLTGDGIADIVGVGSSSIFVLVGGGHGSFSLAPDQFIGFGSGGPAAVADVNGDGKPDLLIARAPGVGVLFNRGNGTFLPAVSYATGPRPWAIAAVDVTGDHTLDLVVSDITSNAVSVLAGRGDGTFLTKPDTPVMHQPLAMAVVDVSRDGRPDLVLATNDADAFHYKVSVWRGDGQGGFTVAGVEYPVRFQLGQARMIAADVTGDGNPDIVVNDQDTQVVTNLNVLVGRGDATFATAVDYAVGASVSSDAVIDVNGDGDLDVVTANHDANTVSVLLGRGDATFGAAVSYATGAGPWFVTAGDVNEDGAIDVVTTNELGNTVSVLLGNGDGALRAAVSYATDTQPWSVAIADLDRDGHLDLVTANRFNSTLSVLLGRGDGTFRAAVTFRTGAAPQTVVAADVDRDGRLDLVTSDANQNAVSVLLGRGDATFLPRVDYETPTSPQWLSLADVNGDGALDLVVGSTFTTTIGVAGTVSVLLGRGDGTFSSRVDYAAGQLPLAGEVADVDGDGQLDILTGNANGLSISVLSGLGDGTFRARRDYAAWGHRAFRVADVDQDGRPDLVVASDARGVSVLRATCLP